MNTSNNGGWLRLDRSVLNSWAGEKPERFFRYADLLSLAAFEDTTVYIRNNNIRLQRGELAVTTTFLARRWGITRQSAALFIQQLIDHSLLIKKEVSGVTVYIIGIEAIELYNSNAGAKNTCSSPCIDDCQTDCATACSTKSDQSNNYDTSACASPSVSPAHKPAGLLTQYKNKEKRINKSIINNKPKNDEWKRRRGQYTTARSWRDYDEPFV